MIKRFAYIVVILIFASCLSFANTIKSDRNVINFLSSKLKVPSIEMGTDTVIKKSKQQLEEEKKKVKEIAKAKRQAKPEKLETPATPVVKPKRERRPEGLERPPEIPRRNGN